VVVVLVVATGAGPLFRAGLFRLLAGIGVAGGTAVGLGFRTFSGCDLFRFLFRLFLVLV
jgi:hypothetical protein